MNGALIHQLSCVANGQSDLATQTAFRMASEFDPEGSRTVGVITKCDVAQNKKDVSDKVTRFSFVKAKIGEGCGACAEQREAPGSRMVCGPQPYAGGGNGGDRASRTS